MLLFDARGNLIKQEVIASEGPVYGLEIAEGVYHSILALSPACAVFEVKEGPYQPQRDKDFPEEGTDEAARLVERWHGLFRFGARPQWNSPRDPQELSIFPS